VTIAAIALAALTVSAVGALAWAALAARRAAQTATAEANDAAIRALGAEAQRNQTQQTLAVVTRERDVARNDRDIAQAALAAERGKRQEHHVENARTDAPGGGAAVDAAVARLRPKDGAR
jgi:aryl-alcohol dehydrogenase-like predicted oxidoreductase